MLPFGCSYANTETEEKEILTSLGVGISIFPQTIGVSNGLVVSKVVARPSRQVEYILVWNKGQAPSGLTREFIRYVQADRFDPGLPAGDDERLPHQAGQGDGVRPSATRSRPWRRNWGSSSFSGGSGVWS